MSDTVKNGNGILKAVQIDTRLHIVSLIIACLAIGGMYYKLNALGESFEKLEARLTRSESVQTSVAVLQSQYAQMQTSLFEIKQQQRETLNEIRKNDR